MSTKKRYEDRERLDETRLFAEADVRVQSEMIGKLEVRRTLGANPVVRLDLRVIEAMKWKDLPLVTVEPRAARHLAYALLMAANECEP